MRTILLLTLLLTFAQADYIKKTIGVCHSKESMKDLKEYAKKHILEKGGLEVELWLLKHDCKIIDKNTKIDVLDYTGKQQEILKLRLKASNEIVYAFNKGIQVEQPGEKNIIYKF